MGTQWARRLAVTALCLVAAGCIRNDLARSNVIDCEPAIHEEPARWKVFLRQTYMYPVARWYIPAAGEAANVDANGDVPTGSFFVNRDIAKLTPQEIELGPCATPDVPMPLKAKSVKQGPGRLSFVGTDRGGAGRKHIVKLDPPGHTELATGAEAIATRILWAIGYHVPANRICTIEGTGDPRLDGQRALASEYIEGKICGTWRFRDAYRRREMRALGLVSAWINNVDMNDNNTLVVWRNGQGYFYLIDFDHALGAHTYGPKEPWRGWRNRWDAEEHWRAILSAGLSLLVKRPYLPASPVASTAVGRFDNRVDPRLFRGDIPNYTFYEMTDADAVWMAKRIAQFTPEQIRAAVKAGKYSQKSDEDYLVATLLARRDRICAMYGVAAGK